MTNIDDKTPDSPEDQIRQLQKENNRLQRLIKRHETQLQHLDKMASANEKTNIALYKELEVLQQQAEAQAREAQIEAALERVRARTMGMHKSEELAEVVKLLYKETEPFGVSTFGISIAIFREEEDAVEYWFADNLDSKLLQSYKVAGQKNKVFRQIWGDWKNKIPQRNVYMEGNEKWDYDTFILEETDFSKLPEELKQDIRAHQTVCFTFTFFKYGYFESVDLTIPNEENAQIIIRFAKVFEQTYTRFLDLQKAEAQAREAQIEAALERVRSRTMAMHKTDELRSVINTVFEQLKTLGFDATACGLTLFNKEDKSMTLWLAGFDTDAYPESYFVPYFDHPLYNAQFEAWENGQTYQVFKFEGELKKSYDALIFELGDFKHLPSSATEAILSIETATNCSAFMKYGMLESVMIGDEVLTKQQAVTLQRFAKVFEQTYTRFLDLQRAEAQAREAQIEAALERVRARTMAMHKSDELFELVKLLYKEIESFGVSTFGISIAFFREEENAVEYWFADHLDSNLLQSYKVVGQKHPVFRKIWEAWENNSPQIKIYLEGDDKRSFDTYQFEETDFSKLPEELKQDILNYTTVCLTYTYTKYGYLEAVDLTVPDEENAKVLIRFAKVFEQTYTRFLDLQQAEARAREAVQQASLDRVRAEIASMRSTDDLQRITPLIWRELTTLGVPFFRCGVFIIEEATEHAHVYLSTPTGEAVAALHLKFDSAPVVEAAAQHWRQQQVYREEWSREQFIAWTQSILKQGLIDSPEKYQAGGEAPEKLVLQFVPFTQGMLYIGSSAALSADEIALSQSIAKAFGMAYARYEDFQRMEAAKAQVEAALENLKKTQQQLVTQEKLASLGQLTAGIAHEIKNPLNFVNNFAALSIDLAKELREEVAKQRAEGEGRGAKSDGRDEFESMEEIIETLIQNAEKINLHGKRADGIVKSMMQHARGSSGQRELTDVNHLLDDAVNLSYHGMRAQDSSFNITIEKDYDESVGKLEVVPQDLSRVFLNIVNNACYAAHQKARGKEQGANGNEQINAFTPTLSVSTKNLGDKIEIRIRDNGNGIPAEIREKIFNPFFTTKPAGQGTGLGLSISHDIIVQQHRGEIKVETEEGKFTEFVVRLPKE